MDYNTAMGKVLNTYGVRILTNPFLVRSLLSDFVGSSLEGRRKIDLLFELTFHCDIVGVFQRNGLLLGRKALEKEYARFKGRYSQKEFIDSVNPVSVFLCPSAFAEEERKKSEKKASSSPQGATKTIKKRANPPLFYCFSKKSDGKLNGLF